MFFIYSVVKPLASAGILVVMYGVIAQGNFGTPIFAYLYIGNAFYQYVAAVMTGVSWAVMDDREHYRTLKYIYTAPVNIPFYLMGARRGPHPDRHIFGGGDHDLRHSVPASAL